jgi:integrase
MIQWDGKPMFPATLLINLGIDVATVAKRLGHAQNSTTLNFYTHAISSPDKAAAKRLREILIR